MALIPEKNRSVLIVDRDESIAKMLTHVLGRSGFSVRVAADVEAALIVVKKSVPDVVLFDVIPGAAKDLAAVRQLGAASPGLLGRTIIATTSPRRVSSLKDAAGVYATLGKPFDLAELVKVVTACADRPRIASLERFVADIPALRRLLGDSALSRRELQLRGEIRRTILELSAVLDEVAQSETSRTRAAAYRAASNVAAELATNAPVAAAPRTSHRNH
jgi:DNA-binding NtrC family response regulator